MYPFIETIRIENGQIWNLPYHNRRMNETRRVHYPDAERINLADFIHPESYGERTKCRVEYASELLNMEYQPYHIRPVSSLRLVRSDTVSYRYKSTERTALNELFAQREEADDVLIVYNDFLTDTSICNMALWNGNCWHTPHAPLLEGTKRASLIDAGILSPAEIRVTDLNRYSHICLFNAMIEFGEIEFPVDKILL